MILLSIDLAGLWDVWSPVIYNGGIFLVYLLTWGRHLWQKKT